jgi:hypothetical protein
MENWKCTIHCHERCPVRHARDRSAQATFGIDRTAIEAAPSALRGRNFVTVSLILRIVSNLEQSWLRETYSSTQGGDVCFEAGSRNSEGAFLLPRERTEAER